MSDYTPTTPVIRGAYVQLNSGTSWDSKQPRLAEFDRWLDQTLREAKAEAWDEGRAQAVHEAFVHLFKLESTTPPKPQPNPYQQVQDR